MAFVLKKGSEFHEKNHRISISYFEFDGYERDSVCRASVSVQILQVREVRMPSKIKEFQLAEGKAFSDLAFRWIDEIRSISGTKRSFGCFRCHCHR